MYYRNIQTLAIEIYKVVNGISSIIMNFNLEKNLIITYVMQSKSNMTQIHSVYHGSVPALYLVHKIWEITCRICKSYIPNVGFL